MTTNDYDARLARLQDAKGGDTVTVPDGWTAPDEHSRFRGLIAGDVLTHDGGTDDIPWKLPSGARSRVTARTWLSDKDVAALGLDVDQADEPTVCIAPADAKLPTDGTLPDGAVPLGKIDADSISADPDEDDEDDDEDDDEATVSVRIVPDTTGFTEALRRVTREVADAEDELGFRLDEFQRERVAALEQSLRILESRRSPRAGDGGGVFAGLFAKGTDVPMVPVQDLVDVAAFIADADTGRAEVQA